MQKLLNTKLTLNRKKISKLIAKDLKKEKFFLLELILLIKNLNGDINVTSPTGLKTFYDFQIKILAKTFGKKLKA